MFAALEDKVQDACRSVRLSFSQTANMLNDIGRPDPAVHSEPARRRHSQPASVSSAVHDQGSGLSLVYRPRRSKSLGRPSNGFGSFDNVTIRILPQNNVPGSSSMVGRAASSALSGIKSKLGFDSQVSEEAALVALARQYTAGLDVDDSDWTIRRAGNTARYNEDVRRRSPVRFRILYNATANILQVRYSCTPGFIRGLQEEPTSPIVCEVFLMPDCRRKKFVVLKNGTEYQGTRVTFHGVAAAELGDKTLNLTIKSKRKVWQKDMILWRNSVSLTDLPVSRDISVFWEQ